MAYSQMPRWPVVFAMINFVAAVSATAGTSLFLHRLLPLPDVPQLSAKLRQLQSIKEEVSLLFVGSSLIGRQLVPEVFDEQLGRHGLRVTSYNLGVDGMQSLEADFVLLQALQKQQFPALRWVVLEAVGFPRRVDSSQAETIRAMYWRDFRRLRPVVAALHRDAFAGRRARRVLKRARKIIIRTINFGRSLVPHVRLTLLNYANVGRVSTYISERIEPRVEQVPTARGFFPVEAALDAEGEAQLRELLACDGSPMPWGDRHSVAILRETARWLQTRGITTLLIVPPDVHALGGDNGALAAATALPSMAFDNPLLYPELYDPAHRYDLRHLNRIGAEIFTRLVASDFVQRTGQSP